MRKTQKIFNISYLVIFLTGANLFFLYANSLKKNATPKESLITSITQNDIKNEEQILLDESKKLENYPQNLVNNNLRSTFIVLRFSFQNCDLCTESIFNHLEELCKGAFVKSENLKLFGTFYANRDAVLLSNRKMLPYEITSVEKDYFNFELEKDATYPFFFVLLPDGTARHFFVPTKENLDRTRRYLEIMQQRYFAKQ